MSENSDELEDVTDGIYKEIDEQLKDEENEGENHADSRPDRFDIAVYPADIQLQDYLTRWDRGEFKIPDFQRDYVWDQSKASKLIESFLLGLPVPAVFLYRGKTENLIVDGQQRIVSIASFLSGKFVLGESKDKKFFLKKVRTRWDKKTFEELDEETKFVLRSATMRATIIEQLKPSNDSSIYEIFERLNTGGVALNPMEVRMCVGSGIFTNLLRKLNKLENWKVLVGEKKVSQRYRDLELILRFFALQECHSEYRSPMKRFLDDYLEKQKNPCETWIKDKRELFEKAIAKALLIKDSSDILKRMKNLSILDSLLVALASNTTSDATSLKNSYEELFANEDYSEIVYGGKGTAGEAAVKGRIKIAKKILSNG